MVVERAAVLARRRADAADQARRQRRASRHMQERFSPATARAAAEDPTVITDELARLSRPGNDGGAMRRARSHRPPRPPRSATAGSPRHFLDLPGAATVDTAALGLTRLAISDITRHRALGVVHGAA